MAAPSRNSTLNGRRRESAEEGTRQAIAASGARRRARKHRRRDLQGFEQGRSGRRLSELRGGTGGVEGQGAADRRQCRDALFRGASAPSARPRRRRVTSPAEPDTTPVKWTDRPAFRNFLGRVLIGSYIKFVRLTSRVVADPPDFWEKAQPDWPAIAVSWHGQSNLAYVVMPQPQRVALLISMHPDGMMMGAMAKSLGYQTIDGSGASARQSHGTGGLTAFRSMLKVLKSGTPLFATADIPPEPG